MKPCCNKYNCPNPPAYLRAVWDYRDIQHLSLWCEEHFKATHIGSAFKIKPKNQAVWYKLSPFS